MHVKLMNMKWNTPFAILLAGLLGVGVACTSETSAPAGPAPSGATPTTVVTTPPAAATTPSPPATTATPPGQVACPADASVCTFAATLHQQLVAGNVDGAVAALRLQDYE